MKKTIIILAAAMHAAAASADILELRETWDCGSTLTSTLSRTLELRQQVVPQFHPDKGYVTLVADSPDRLNGGSGISMSNDAWGNYGERDWVLQVTFQTPGFYQTDKAQVVMSTDYQGTKGVEIAVAGSGIGGNEYVMAYTEYYGKWTPDKFVSTGLAPAASGTEWATLTLLNYGGTVYTALGEEWSQSTFGDGSGVVLNRLMFGFGRFGECGISTSAMNLDHISISTFSSAAVSLDAVKYAALHAPEPSATTISLLALAALSARRRRK